MGSLSQSKEEQIYFLVRMLFSISVIVLSMSLSVLAEGEVLETNRPRNARLFMVSSSSTTSVSTTTYCYVSGTTAITTACGKRKRSLEAVEHMEDIVSSSVVESLDDVEGDTEVMSGESEPSQRDPRFLLYWMTTTSTSTLTSFTATTSIGTLECTPSSFTISACG